MKYVISTKTNSIRYQNYSTLANGNIPEIIDSVLVRGGAGIPNSRGSGFGEEGQTETGIPFWTPSGMCTPITEAQETALMKNPHFLLDLEKGFVKIISTDVRDNHAAMKKEIRTMETNDPQGLLNPEKFKKTMQARKLQINAGAPVDSISNNFM